MKFLKHETESTVRIIGLKAAKADSGCYQAPNQWQTQINVFVFISSCCLRSWLPAERQSFHLRAVTSANSTHSFTSQRRKFPLQLLLKCLSSTKTPVLATTTHKHTQPLQSSAINIDLHGLLVNKNALLVSSFLLSLRTNGIKRNSQVVEPSWL